MSLLAAAGIYLVLDVNSPAPNHHINRYEPWTSYSDVYMANVFEVVEQFGAYNNTLGFFAGNEVINDELSARHSPVYMKAVIRDIKQYIEKNMPRQIPVGYSAADDLSYRASLSQYLECISDDVSDSVDFYGVNSYQWCGEQTFYSSGYDKLVETYLSYTRPVFFSEYGCNQVTPRKFSEVQCLYSEDMIDVFSGGLVYEFTQEANNYGLVKETENQDVVILDDFLFLKYQMDHLAELNYAHIAEAFRQDSAKIKSTLKKSTHVAPVCEISYPNLDISQGMPPSVASDLIQNGLGKSGKSVERGKFVPLSSSVRRSSHRVYDTNGVDVYLETPTVEPKVDHMEPLQSTAGEGFERNQPSIINNNSTYIQEVDCDSDGNCDYDYDTESDSGSDWDSDSEESEYEADAIGNESIESKAVKNPISSFWHSITGAVTHLFKPQDEVQPVEN